MTTGEKYTVGSLNFIGDSGFTSLSYYANNKYDNREFASLEELQTCIPDCYKIKNFSPDSIRELFSKWNNFVNSQIIEHSYQNKPLFIVTHWEIDAIANDVKESWWKSNYPLKPGYYWKITGHTHLDKHNFNSISTQLGYKDFKQHQNLKISDFGHLVPVNKAYGLIDLKNNMSKFVDFRGLCDTTENVMQKKKIGFYGYKRSGNYVNKLVRQKHAENPQQYVNELKEKLNDYGNFFEGNCDYVDVDGPQLYIAKLAAEEAIQILEKGLSGNVLEFYSATLISGYLYSGRLHLLPLTRKISIYDVIREAMVLQTILSFPEINVSDIKQIKGMNKEEGTIHIAGHDFKIPVIDGHHLNLDDFVNLETAIVKQLALEINSKNLPAI